MKTIRTDILVAGGGSAGCAAAIAAAREGHKVILLEKSNICGGLATAGNVIYYLPLCDGYGKQVISGLSAELMHASIKYGPGKILNWKKTKGYRSRYLVLGFNPASFVLAIDEMLRDAGVDVWFDTVVIKAIRKGNVLTAIECYNKSGILRIEAACFIDATGDADLAISAGCAYDIGQSIMTGWTLEMSPENEPYRLRVNPGNGEDVMEGISGRIYSQYTLRSRQLLLESYKKKWQKPGHNRNNTYPVVLPTQQNMRKTRAIKGRATMDDTNAWSNFPDSVGIFQASTSLETSTMWSIPYGALLPLDLDNLLVAGRCISSRGWCWDNTRLIPIAAQTGNIAGIAASQCVSTSKTPQTLPVGKLQKRLSEQGHLLNFEMAYGEGWKAIAKERFATRKNHNAHVTSSH